MRVAGMVHLHHATHASHLHAPLNSCDVPCARLVEHRLLLLVPRTGPVQRIGRDQVQAHLHSTHTHRALYVASVAIRSAYD